MIALLFVYLFGAMLLCLYFCSHVVRIHDAESWKEVAILTAAGMAAGLLWPLEIALAVLFFTLDWIWNGDYP